MKLTVRLRNSRDRAIAAGVVLLPQVHQRQRMSTVLQAVLMGVGVLLAGTLPRNLLFAANVQFLPHVPWAPALMVIYMWVFWRYMNGAWWPQDTSAARRELMRARPLGVSVWTWALIAGALAIVALVLVLRVMNRLVEMPVQQVPDVSHVAPVTLLSMLVVGAAGREKEATGAR